MSGAAKYTTPAAVAAWERGSAETVLCETQLMPHKGQYELEQDPSPPSRKTKNEDGLMIWARVKASSNAVYAPGALLKVHMCFHNPCRAHWTDAKYGGRGIPVHMQCITCIGPKAAPLLPLTAAPVADPSSITEPVAVPAAPSTTTPAAVAAQTPAAAAVAAMERIKASALQLARQIRQPKSYIGYVAFVLFSLLKKTRMQMWEGTNKFCLIDTFAPQFKDMCTKETAVAAIPCALTRNWQTGVVECVQISEVHQLTRMSHYVAGFHIPSAPVTAGEPHPIDESAFAAFYKGLGVHYLQTICDGDCGIDVMCLVEGVERTLDERTRLRAEISDYLIHRLHLDWMIDILRVTQEINDDDFKLAKSADIPIAQELPMTAVAAAAGDAFEGTVAAIACDDDGVGELEPLSEDAMNAMRWASKLPNDCTVVELVRALPHAVVQEQIRLWKARGTTTAAVAVQKIVVGASPSSHVRNSVAKRFQ